MYQYNRIDYFLSSTLLIDESYVQWVDGFQQKNLSLYRNIFTLSVKWEAGILPNIIMRIASILFVLKTKSFIPHVFLIL